MVAAWEELCLTMRVSAGFVKLRVAALKELLQAGVNFGDEGGQCSARIKSVNFTVTASWEELCLTMQCTLLLFFRWNSVSQRRSTMQYKLRQAQRCCSFGGTCLTMQCRLSEAQGLLQPGWNPVSQRRSTMQCKLRQAQGCCSFGRNCVCCVAAA